MNLELICDALRSPAGLPSSPVIFLVLLVVTWTVHILAVHIMLGSTALSLFGAYRQNPYWQKLSDIMLETAKIAVSIAIVLGVAPLLFVQVLYDPFWFTSNVLSARWVIAFIFILLTAYYLMYHRYFASKKTDGKDHSRISLGISLALLLLVGFIMHSLVSQMLRPELWQEWYAPGGHIDFSGSKLHEYNLWRYLYFIGLSVPVVGAWLCGYKTYLSQRNTEDTAYLAWVENLGKKLMSGGGLLALLFYVLWMSSLPDNIKSFSVSAGSILGLTATFVLAIIPVILKPSRLGYGAMITASVAMLMIAIARESLRISTLSKTCNYNLFDYPVHFDGYSTALFFLTFIFLGIPVISYSIALCWQAGLSRGVYTATPRVAQLGRFSLIALAVWIAQYFLFGFITVIWH